MRPLRPLDGRGMVFDVVNARATHPTFTAFGGAYAPTGGGVDV